MEVEVYQAELVINKKRRRLTKGIAKQFPVRPGRSRQDAIFGGEPVATPLCKVRGETLGTIRGWLYLVRDEDAGLVWEPAVVLHKHQEERLRETGRTPDTPLSDVPTVIL